MIRLLQMSKEQIREAHFTNGLHTCIKPTVKYKGISDINLILCRTKYMMHFVRSLVEYT